MMNVNPSDEMSRSVSIGAAADGAGAGADISVCGWRWEIVGGWEE